MKVFGLVGWSGSGKTTLLEMVVPLLTERGLRVSTIKHSHHDFDIDKPGKDSYRHRQAGATEVMVASGMRWALMREHRGAPEPLLDDLLAVMTPVDLVLIEGFKHDPVDKIEVYRPALGKPPLWSTDPHVVAVATDGEVEVGSLPLLDLNDAAAVAKFIVMRTGLGG